MRLQFLGSGDAFGSGGRFNTCFLVAASATRFLIDFGATSLVAMQRAGIDPNAIDTVFITHLHGDHFGGLPFLILHAQFIGRRKKPLTLAGPPGLETRLMQAMEVFFPGSAVWERGFALDILELEAEAQATVNGVAVTPYSVQHPSGAPSYALRFELDGKILTYSGDTEWTEALVPAGRDADLFICEAYTYEKAVRTHMAFQKLRSHLAEIRPQRMIITHMSHDMLGRDLSCDLPQGCVPAEDGMVVEI